MLNEIHQTLVLELEHCVLVLQVDREVQPPCGRAIRSTSVAKRGAKLQQRSPPGGPLGIGDRPRIACVSCGTCAHSHGCVQVCGREAKGEGWAMVDRKSSAAAKLPDTHCRNRSPRPAVGRRLPQMGHSGDAAHRFSRLLSFAVLPGLVSPSSTAEGQRRVVWAAEGAMRCDWFHQHTGRRIGSIQGGGTVRGPAGRAPAPAAYL